MSIDPNFVELTADVLRPTIMGNIFSDFSLQQGSPTPKLKPSTMGPEIIGISGFRNNRGQKSAE